MATTTNRELEVASLTQLVAILMHKLETLYNDDEATLSQAMSMEKLLKKAEQKLSALEALQGETLPWEDEPDWCEGAAPMPPVRSFKERCAEARARAMSTGKAVLV